MLNPSNMFTYTVFIHVACVYGHKLILPVVCSLDEVMASAKWRVGPINGTHGKAGLEGCGWECYRVCNWECFWEFDCRETHCYSAVRIQVLISVSTKS
uniref:Uncharacterized protein n=1 Tax=Anguilla anguilla TaxID=7936 RepID=A0A0E9X0N7_ANGAN